MEEMLIKIKNAQITALFAAVTQLNTMITLIIAENYHHQQPTEYQSLGIPKLDI